MSAVWRNVLSSSDEDDGKETPVCKRNQTSSRMGNHFSQAGNDMQPIYKYSHDSHLNAAPSDARSGNKRLGQNSGQRGKPSSGFRGRRGRRPSSPVLHSGGPTNVPSVGTENTAGARNRIKYNSRGSSISMQSRSCSRLATNGVPSKKPVVVEQQGTEYVMPGKPALKSGRSSRTEFNEASAEQENDLGTKPCKTRKYPMGFKKLEEMSSKDESEILLRLCAPENGFEHSLNSTSSSREVMAYLLICIGKACKSNHRNNVMALINMVTKNDNFMFCSLQRYLAGFLNSEVKSHHKDSLLKMLDFLSCYRQALPATASESITMIMPLFKETYKRVFSDELDVQKEIGELISEIEMENITFIKDHTPADVKTVSRNERMNIQQPPENYRTIPVLPDSRDIAHHSPFLRPNIVDGKYSDTDHYLDVQFRLLREDYVRPLREGINSYIILKKKNKVVGKIDNARIYENVHILKLQFYQGLVIHTAQLDMSKLQNIRWESSKRFLSGSLLCLSSDDFHTMHFASVMHRDATKLRDGYLFLHFESLSSDVMNFSPLTNFLIIETNAYFEAYRHNLDALQKMVAERFPFQDYIVRIQKHVAPPAYLQPFSAYDISPLFLPLNTPIKDGTSKCARKIELLDHSQWPTAVDLGLDNSQFEALKAAVTKEFAIIQGPPGTGKTYVGLRIVQLLLHNASVWQPTTGKKSPILIVCYTNHALDQFLEGVSVFTENIVRVGGRCSVEALSEFQLRSLKKSIREKREVPNHIFSNIRHTYFVIGEYQKSMNVSQTDMLKCSKSVISETSLRRFMKEEHYAELKYLAMSNGMADDNYIICDWLGTRFRFVGGTETFQNQNLVKVRNHDDYWATSDGQLVCTNSFPDYPVCNAEKTAADFAENSSLFDEEEEGEDDIDVIEAMRDVETEDFSQFFLGVDDDDEDGNDMDETPFLDDSGWQTQGGNKKRRQYIARQLHSAVAMSEADAARVVSIQALNINDRWRLYKYWVQKYINEKQLECLKLGNEIRSELNRLDEMRIEEDLYVLQKAEVVGMTTTGAAKYRNLVVGLNPRIIIVEEAAEILESHIVTSLSEGTQHLILIGDHQQLRPSPNVYDLAIKFKLDVSLFERMVNNGMDFCQLEIQHRMRPCISSLLVPHIYPTLLNHESVHLYENIKGIRKNMFFISHSFTEGHVTDSASKVNLHEAHFITQLCKYILLQGYSSSQITILTTYSGQMFAIRNLTKAELYKGVRVTVVDNFQGEENDIILISFVRSNEDGNIGFLKTSNRVCVALSRAKKGLYCTGNFDLLAEKSELWKEIVEKLKNQKAIGSSLELQCQSHPEKIFQVSSESDFAQVREGGCSQPCDYRLKCGHTCAMMCHPYDPEHSKVKCYKDCEVLCSVGHKCPLKCSQTCGPCKVRVEKTLPYCSHIVMVPCHVSADEFVCDKPCYKILECGHKCQNACGVSCTYKCHVLVDVTLECNHQVKVECHSSLTSKSSLYLCKEPCNIELQCGHKCSGNCGACQQGRLHKACMQRCTRILVCGHECKSQCQRSCPPCRKKCQNRCVHSKCPKKCGLNCQTCIEPCPWECEHYKCTKRCGEICDRPPCNEPCGVKLKCGHNCVGLCGEPCPEKCAVCNPELKETFLGGEDEDDARYVQLECRHIFEVEDITRWMNMDIDSDEIKMKTCPRCKTVIRTSLRFGNVVKRCLENIERVKIKVFGNEEKNEVLQKIVHDKVHKLHSLLRSSSALQLSGALKSLMHVLKPENQLSASDIMRYENVLSILENFFSLRKQLENSDMNLTTDSEVIRECSKRISSFSASTRALIEEFIIQEVATASEQQLEDITWEIQRLRLLCSFLDFLKKHNIVNFFQRKEIASSATYNSESLFTSIAKSLCKLGPFRSEEERDFNSSFKALSKALGTAVLNVTEAEKKLILKAMNLSQGHWFKCPNGHVYCITECGGAMEESKCNECSAAIGGQRHALRSDNRLATEMDGSQYSAWSQATDLRNYVDFEFE